MFWRPKIRHTIQSIHMFDIRIEYNPFVLLHKLVPIVSYCFLYIFYLFLVYHFTNTPSVSVSPEMPKPTMCLSNIFFNPWGYWFLIVSFPFCYFLQSSSSIWFISSLSLHFCSYGYGEQKVRLYVVGWIGLVLFFYFLDFNQVCIFISF